MPLSGMNSTALPSFIASNLLPKRRTAQHLVALAATAILCVISGSWVWADEPSGVQVAPAASPRAPQPAENELVEAEVFISSPFADFFLAGDYQSALSASDILIKEYPNDPLLKRYRAIVLGRLDRYDEAMKLYEGLLLRDPDHVPTRFFRAQTYHRNGETDRAIAELEWVVKNSPTKQYKQWAQKLLSRLGVRPKRPLDPKKMFMFGNIGWEYDTNVILKSNDPGAALGTDKNASRLPVNLGIGYRVIQKPDFRFDTVYTTRQSFNDDRLSEYNFTSQELSLRLRNRTNFLDHDVRFGSRYDLLVGFLDRNLFSVSNRLRLSADTRLTPRTRTYFYNRFTVSNFGSDGAYPTQTSRDGFYYDAGVTHYYYSEDFRSFIFVGEEFELDQTRGANFTRRGATTRIGFRTPVPENLIPRTRLDANMGFRFGSYPRFESRSSRDRNRRRSRDLTYYVALTHRIRPRLRGRLFYRHIDANNRNDIYQYDRDVVGMQLLFTQYF